MVPLEIMLESWQDRLLQEASELVTKIHKLDLHLRELQITASEDESSYMDYKLKQQQLKAMRDYLQCLYSRIGLFVLKTI